jgi:hypothetical protein
MAVVISLDAWRRERTPGREGPRGAPPAKRRGTGLAAPEHVGDCARLQRAVERLDLLAGSRADRDRLAPDVERDMLTIVGELAMGWLDQAADRAERLCDRLVAQGG